jgi:hypothetical protein
VPGQRGDRDAENPLQVLNTLRLLFAHQGHAFVPTRQLQLFGHRRMDRSTVGVAADVVLRHGRDDIGSPALLQRPGLLADDEEGALHAHLGHDLGQPERDVIESLGGRSGVVLDVENDRDQGAWILRGAGNRPQEEEGDREGSDGSRPVG